MDLGVPNVMYFDDTIAAIATPMGEGGIGIIRISGPESLKLAGSILKSATGKPIPNVQHHQIYYGRVVDPLTDQMIDEVLFFYAKKPHSYTTEDVIEIQAHGGMYVLAQILNLTLQNGARLAEPGEFTQRAYLNGRIDLVQAEAIIDLIRAQTEQAHLLAVSQLNGRIAQKIEALETEVYQVLIAMEAVLDFPEEGLAEPDKDLILAQMTLVYQQLVELLANTAEGQKIRDGVLIVIVGRPNVGKSSLLNTFLQEEKAIVTEIPGTTRDIIEAQFQLRGVPIRLVDTAGFRETDNPIEKIGMAKAETYLKDADLILWVLDASQPLAQEDRTVAAKLHNKPVLAVINKTDLPAQMQRQELDSFNLPKILETSLLTGEGVGAIEQAIIDLVGLGQLKVDDRPFLARVRHKQALEQAISYLDNFTCGLNDNISEDLLAVDLRGVLEALGEITGKKVNEEVLHGIFAQFCIGK